MWIRPLALAAGALLLAGAFPALAVPLLLVAVVGCGWAFTVGLLPRLHRRDPYGLGELRRIHEAEELRSLDDEGVLGDPEKVVCSRCFTEYPHRLGACPKCGASG